MNLYLRSDSIETGSGPPLTVHAPSAAYTGPDKPQPAIPWEQADVPDSVGLYEYNLESEDWRPVTVATGQAPAWTLNRSATALALSDAVLASWWRLTSQQDRP